MGLSWRAGTGKEDTLMADSEFWLDDGVPLSYSVDYTDDEWTAWFEGASLYRGSLRLALSACEDADAKAIADAKVES